MYLPWLYNIYSQSNSHNITYPVHMQTIKFRYPHCDSYFHLPHDIDKYDHIYTTSCLLKTNTYNRQCTWIHIPRTQGTCSFWSMTGSLRTCGQVANHMFVSGHVHVTICDNCMRNRGHLTHMQNQSPCLTF